MAYAQTWSAAAAAVCWSMMMMMSGSNVASSSLNLWWLPLRGHDSDVRMTRDVSRTNSHLVDWWNSERMARSETYSKSDLKTILYSAIFTKSSVNQKSWKQPGCPGIDTRTSSSSWTVYCWIWKELCYWCNSSINLFIDVLIKITALIDLMCAVIFSLAFFIFTAAHKLWFCFLVFSHFLWCC